MHGIDDPHQELETSGTCDARTVRWTAMGARTERGTPELLTTQRRVLLRRLTSTYS